MKNWISSIFSVRISIKNSTTVLNYNLNYINNIYVISHPPKKQSIQKGALIMSYQQVLE